MGELVLAHTARRARLFKEAEREARREIEAAVTLEEVEQSWPPLWDEEASDKWYEAVFGATERELEELRAAAAAQYRRLRFSTRRAERREALETYIKTDARLMAAHGLEVVWT